MADKNVVKPVVVNTSGLYEKHRTIYAKSVRGVFDNWRWIMVFVTQALFYGLCWIDWDGKRYSSIWSSASSMSWAWFSGRRMQSTSPCSW